MAGQLLLLRSSASAASAAQRGLIAIVLVMASVQHASGIRCWECNSKHDPRCGDPFGNYSVATVDCDQRQDSVTHLELEMTQDGEPMPKAALCRKTVQTVEGELRIVRGCGWVENDGHLKDRTCFHRTGTKEIQIHHCVCHTDMCNGAPRKSSSSLVSLVVFGLLSATLASSGLGRL